MLTKLLAVATQPMNADISVCTMFLFNSLINRIRKLGHEVSEKKKYKHVAGIKRCDIHRVITTEAKY